MKGPFVVAAACSARRQGLLAVCTVVALVMLSAGSSIGDQHETASLETSSGPPGDPRPGSSGPSENIQEGRILLATPEQARTFSAQSMHEVSHYRVIVQPQAPFQVRSLESPSEFCFAGQCIETPDFDIAFFKQRSDGSASVVERAYGQGPPEGAVPDSATFAHVYLRTAGGDPDGSDGYGFVYLQGNPNSEVIPHWPPE